MDALEALNPDCGTLLRLYNSIAKPQTEKKDNINNDKNNVIFMAKFSQECLKTD